MRRFSPLLLSLCLAAAVSGAAGQARNNVPDPVPGAPTGTLHDMMTSYGIANSFEIYPVTHTSNVAFRFQDFVLPFFSKNLSFESRR